MRFFYNLFTAPRTVSNTYAHVILVCANHVQHIERLSRATVVLRATRYEGTAQLLSLTEFKSLLFEVFFILAEPLIEKRTLVSRQKTASPTTHLFLVYNRAKNNFTVYLDFSPHSVLVVKRPLRERKIPGSNPACAGIFSGSSHTSDFKIGTQVATLPGAWRYRVSTGTGRPGVSIL